MYPPQTSFIPVQIALVRFLEGQGFLAAFGNYPYWYLGTTPYRYLTGPILPSILTFLHKIANIFSLFEIMFWLMAGTWLLGVIGIYLLVREIKIQTQIPFLTAVFYLFGPFIPFLFRFSNGSHFIAFSLLPLVLFFYAKLLKNWQFKTSLWLVLLISFVLLVDISIFSSLFLGMGALFLAMVGWKKAEEKVKKSCLLLAISYLLTTIWYTPGYWWTLWKSPSFGGKPVVEVVFWLGKLLPVALAFVLAIVSVKFFKKKDKLRDFCFYWLFIFGFLTLMRFLSDPNFWLDWSIYNLEMQIGLAILGGLILDKILSIKRQMVRNILFSLCVFTPYLLMFTFVFNKYVLATLQRDMTKAVEYRIGKQLSELIKPGEKVFLSGSTAFWLNTFFDIPQVRGGADQVSVDPWWRKAAWEIREGTDPEKALEWLKQLEISYLVVHTQDSEEFYHDFVYPEKFEGVAGLEKIWEEKGDRIYRVLLRQNRQ